MLQLEIMPVPQQTYWMIKKIFNARTQLGLIQPVTEKQTYQEYLSENVRCPIKMTWKGLMFLNNARPKEVFTMWL